jgi:hypothetical protein
MGIQEVENFISTLNRTRTPISRKADLFEIEQLGPFNYKVPTGKLDAKGKPETFKIDGYRGRTIVDAKFTENPDRSLYISTSNAPQFIKDNALRQERDQFRRAKDIIDNPSLPFDALDILVNDSRLVPYFDSLLKEYNIPGQVRVVPTQIQ